MKRNDSGTVRVLVGAAALTIAVSSAASSQDLSKLPALAPALSELKSELSLTDAQSEEATKILIELLSGAKGAVDRFGGLNFDSLLDLLVEARSMRQEYVPRITGLLTEEQKGKLAKLPKNHDIYTSAMAGWLAEASSAS